MLLKWIDSKKHQIKKWKIVATTMSIAGGFLLFNYQACGPGYRATSPLPDLPEQSADLPSFQLPENHPVLEEPVASSQSPILGSSKFVSNVISDIVTTPASQGTFQYVNLKYSVISMWTERQPHLFGGSCNIYSSWSLADCERVAGNQSAPIRAPMGILRAAATLQVCQRIFGAEDALENARAKIQGGHQAPTAQSIQSAIELFYRGRDIDPSLATELSSIESSEVGGESVSARWQFILVMICESPGWQVL